MTNRTNRDKMKRKLGQSVNNLDLALLDIKIIHDIFEPIHPELAEGLETAAALIVNAQEVIGVFSLAAWNTDKDTLKKYR